MSDFEKLLKQAQRAEVCHANMQERRTTATLQWFLENEVATHPIHNRNDLRLLVCGEAGFAAIERDIRAATSTIDLVCWGFDPAMELTRASGQGDADSQGRRHWPRGTTYGDLLSDKGRQGVQVRLLLWYDAAYLNLIEGNQPLFGGYLWQALKMVKNHLVHQGAGNAPDLPLAWPQEPPTAPVHLRAPRPRRPVGEATQQEARTAYAQAWWRAALSGGLPGVEVRFRQTRTADIVALKNQHLPGAASLTEAGSMAFVGTHHQKPILIDYHPGQGRYPDAAQARPHTCGYVMGLNSVTSYWDSERHLYNDPRREVAFGKGGPRSWHVKPYRDYAIRVEGEVLACLNRNFVNAWDAAEKTHPQASTQSLKAQRAQLQPPPKGQHRAQIVRTHPEERDATILKTYALATSNAVNYIYVENQYVQLAEWVRFIKAVRRRQESFATKAKARPRDIPALHLMVVMPQPERGAMVPSTYDALAQMGQAQTVRGYHERVEDLRQGRELDGVVPTGQLWLKSSLKATPPQAQIQKELERLNIKTLVAMLMTYDHENEARQMLIGQRDNDAQEAQAKAEARRSPAKRASDVHATAQGPNNIRPRRYREIYIHSKLMLIDDVFITLGSANLNVRSMVGDSELNIACADYGFARDARERVWKNLAGEDLGGGDGSLSMTKTTFEGWEKRMEINASSRPEGIQPENDSFIHTYEDPRSAPWIVLG